MNITEAAFDRITKVLEQEDIPDGASLRVYIQGGGCSGFNYGFTISESVEDDDMVFNKGDTKVVIDPMSLMYLEGATLDFQIGLQGENFVFNNPNAVTKCGCGSSFGV